MTASLPWHKKTVGVPQMPGTIDDALPNLRGLLNAVMGVDGDLEAEIEWPAGKRTTLRQGVNRLGKCGLIKRLSKDKIALTVDAQRWLANDDPSSLVDVLQGHVQFIGELLHELHGSPDGLTHEEIRGRATGIYRCPWNSMDPIRKRTSWLRALGMAYLRFDNRIAITDAGINKLEGLSIAGADDVSGPGSTELDPAKLIEPPTGEIARTLEDLDNDALKSRSLGFGYIPRPVDSTIPETIYRLISEISANGGRAHFVEECARQFNITEQSAPRVLSMLTTVGLAVQTDVATYSLTPIAIQWHDSRNDLDLVRIFHSSIAVVGELLDAVETHDKAPALSRYAEEVYDFRHDVDGVRVRLHLMTAAGLLQEYGLGRFRITPLGEAFRDSLPRLESTVDVASKVGSPDVSLPHERLKSAESLLLGATEIAGELREAGRDSDHPDRLERAVRDAFRYLGFEAEQLGGAGKTDVLVSYSDRPGRTTTVCVDAKSAASGVVAENSVNFPTIADHRKAHEADLSCLVGPKFHASRLPKWARDQGVALVETELLASIVLRQGELPIGTQEIARIFDADNDAGRSIRESWERIERRNRIFAAVVAALSREAATPDEVTNGALSLDNLYFLLRNDLEAKPDPASIAQAVEFLTSPLVSCVSSTAKNVFVATERPVTIARKLRGLATAAQKAADLIDG